MIYYGLEWQSLDTYFQMKEVTAPGTPVTNELRLYAKDKSSVSALYVKDDAGIEHELTNRVGGSGAANRVAYWSGALVLAANAALTAKSMLFGDANGLPNSSANMLYDPTVAAGRGRLLLQADTDNNIRIELRGYGTAIDPVFQGIHGAGTVASPTASVADYILCGLAGGGYDNAGTPAVAASKAIIRLCASQNWTTTAQGTYIAFGTTPSGSTTRADQVRIPEDGGIAIVDGITAPATLSGWAKIYVDTADGDLKIKYGDGTVKTIVVDT